LIDSYCSLESRVSGKGILELLADIALLLFVAEFVLDGDRGGMLEEGLISKDFLESHLAKTDFFVGNDKAQLDAVKVVLDVTVVPADELTDHLLKIQDVRD